MTNSDDIVPSGLSRSQMKRLTALTRSTMSLGVEELLLQVDRHLEVTRQQHAQNCMVNVRLAEAIVATLHRLADAWSEQPADNKTWLKAAMAYFSDLDDEEHDFHSLLGFEDDTEVLNACLRFAELSELCVDVEDFDGA